MLNLKPEIQHNEVVCTDLNAHDPIKENQGTADERVAMLFYIVMDANSTFISNGQPSKSDPDTAGLTSYGVTIVNDSHQDKCNWRPLPILSFYHKPQIDGSHPTKITYYGEDD